ncbi:MAG: extracellular solute-binding protein [Lachnospiraceae bacterium]|nr:extracellular solute-binding protein [Lachnospiraceae bacterium]
MKCPKLLIPMILSSLLLSGCSGSGTEKNAPSGSDTDYTGADPVDLDFYVWDDGERYVTNVVDAFNAMHNDIHVNVIFVDSEDYEGRLEKIFQENHVDIFASKGMSPLISEIEQGYVMDITPYVNQSAQDGSLDLTAFGNMFNDVTYEDRYYSFPSRATCWELYYNKDLFDAAGLPYPQQMTWEEYADLAVKLTDPEKGIYGGYWANWIPNFYALQHGSYLIDDDLTYIREGVELLNRFYNEDKSHVSYADMEQGEDPSYDVFAMFESGKIAMCPQGEWMLNILLEDQTSVHWDVAPMPVPEGVESGTSWGQYQFVAMGSSCTDPDASWVFMKFFCGREGSLIRAQNAIIPAYTDDDIIREYLSAAQTEHARYFFDAKKYQEQLPLKGYEDTRQAFADLVTSYMMGEISLDECMDAFDTQRQSFFQ